MTYSEDSWREWGAQFGWRLLDMDEAFACFVTDVEKNEHLVISNDERAR